MQLQAQGALEKMKHPPKQVGESIAFKDLGPSGKLQVGAQAGLDLHADVAADMAEEQLNPNQGKPPADGATQ